MKNKITAIALASVIAATGLSAVSAGASAEWVKSGSSYSYKDDATGEKLTGWQDIDGNRYYFGKDGKSFTGWKKINGKTYYFDKSKKGKMITGTVKIGGKKYTFGEDGVLESQAAAKKSSSGIPFGTSKKALKKQIRDKGYDILGEDGSMLAFGKEDEMKMYGYVFDDDDRMQMYLTADEGNSVKSLKKTFDDRGYTVQESEKKDGNEYYLLVKSNSIVFCGYYGDYDFTVVIYVSPEYSHEIIEGDFDYSSLEELVMY